MTTHSLYRGLDREALDVQYNARATVQDIGPTLKSYAELSETARRTLPCALNVAYGPHPDETLDIFPGATEQPGPVLIYLHGGYWRLLSKDDSSFMAPALSQKGITVVAVNYSLAPAVTLDHIVDQTRRALGWISKHIAQHHGNPQQLIVAGSSAGGHLAGMALVPGWQQRYGVQPGSIRGAVLLSGLFDLTPLVHTHINEWMQMSDAGARLNSPMLHMPDAGPHILVSYGTNETDEFKRQSIDFLAAWQARGLSGEYIDMPGTNHFDLVLSLGDPVSALAGALLRLTESLDDSVPPAGKQVPKIV